MDNIHNPPLLSVHILLPDAIDRRLRRRTQEMPGASWPSWGGHITLVPNFVPKGSLEEIQAALEKVCLDASPFLLHFSAPLAVPDKTRAEYFALFLKIEGRKDEEDGQAENGDNALYELRERLLRALAPLRHDLYPELVEQPFVPHVTLALGVSESEAQTLVRGLRAEPFEAAFWVEEITLVAQGVGDPARLERTSFPVGRAYHDAGLPD